MSDYFERVEGALLRATAEGRHIPWYRRVRLRPYRGAAVVVACLAATGSALAGTGVFQAGTPVSPEVTPLATVDDGAPIPSSGRLLALRVADPDGGPPWGLRTIKTTRGLMCVQLGRIVDGRIGVLGEAGAFRDDGRFHPLSIDYLDAGSSNCATEDAHGNAFLNEEAFGVPTDGLINGEGEVSGGCYGPHPTARSCPPQDLRNIYYGLLGPQASSITYLAGDGKEHEMATVGPDGAYLVVGPHIASACLRGQAECSGRRGGPEIVRSSAGETGGPTLNAFGAVRAVVYRDGSSCRLPSGAEVEASEQADERAFRVRLRKRYPAVYRKLHNAEQHQSGARLSSHERSELESLQQHPPGYSPESPCPAVGYAPLPAAHFTHAELATPVQVRIESAAHYCEEGQLLQPCSVTPPAGSRRIPTQPARHELLELIAFRTRIAITNYNRHYEIQTTAPTSSKCPGGGAFGPSNSNYRAGQEVRLHEFIDADCHGVYHVRIGLVSTDGPSGATPVPGLPGQSAEVPVGEGTFKIP
ncbi:MAG TPA: hypothetical protein VHT29_06800 [Solirubrobacteraceae bacterium]|jgi:hypothetical protein|nr:hypothetical protein [Solirubrobacteraceae bacterium]